MRNARAADAATLTDGGHSERVQMVEISTDDARPLLRVFPAQVPTGVGFMKNAGLVTGPNPDEIRVPRRPLPVFRFDQV